MPHVIVRRFKKDGYRETEYPVYTLPEAEARGIEVVHWTDAVVGDMALSDDNFVVECHKLHRINRKPDRHGRRKYAEKRQFTVAQAWCTYVVDRSGEKPRKVFSGDPHLAINRFLAVGENYNDVKPRTQAAHEALRGRTQRALEVYAVYWHVTGGKLTHRMWVEVGKAYRSSPSTKNPAAQIKKLLKSPEIKAAAVSKIKEIMEGQGVGQAAIAKDLRELLDMAKEKGRISDALKVIDKVQEIQNANEGGNLNKPFGGVPSGGLLEAGAEDADFEEIDDEEFEGAPIKRKGRALPPGEEEADDEG